MLRRWLVVEELPMHETFLSFVIARARHFRSCDLRADVSGLFQVKCAHASVNLCVSRTFTVQPSAARARNLLP